MLVASGNGPYSGQAVHFRNVAPEPKDYAVNRYTFEAQRHWGVLKIVWAGISSCSATNTPSSIWPSGAGPG